MAYSDFKTLSQVTSSFNLTLNETSHLFTNINPIPASDILQENLRDWVPLANAIHTEKARSELIITPILLEVRRLFLGKIGFFSGIEFTVDP